MGEVQIQRVWLAWGDFSPRARSGNNTDSFTLTSRGGSVDRGHGHDLQVDFLFKLCFLGWVKCYVVCYTANSDQ